MATTTHHEDFALPDTKPQETPPRLKLEAFLLYPGGHSDYRFLVQDSHVKYVTIEAGVLLGHNRSSSNLVSFPCRPRVLAAALPSLPPGDWNVRHITTCPLTNAPVFGSTSLQSFPSVRNLWHETVIHRHDLAWSVGGGGGGGVGRFRQNVGLVTCPQFRGRVVYKFATFPWMIQEVERETTAYQVISQHRPDTSSPGPGDKKRFWAPRFLGHVLEDSGRVVGFLIEYIPGRRPDKDNVQDARLCSKTLGKLHEAGLVHGRVDPANFIIQRGKKGDEALLVDFAHTAASEHKSQLLEEMAHLQAILGVHERSTSSEIRV